MRRALYTWNGKQVLIEGDDQVAMVDALREAASLAGNEDQFEGTADDPTRSGRRRPGKVDVSTLVGGSMVLEPATTCLDGDFGDVGRFHEKFGLPFWVPGIAPTEITKGLRDFRIGFLMEEMGELFEGYGMRLTWDAGLQGDEGRPQDLAQVADALVDLCYVALGTAHLHGFPWPELFAAVQGANMQKVRASSAANSKRGSAFDVVKPAGWVAPDVAGILARHGWPRDSGATTRPGRIR